MKFLLQNLVIENRRLLTRRGAFSFSFPFSGTRGAISVEKALESNQKIRDSLKKKNNESIEDVNFTSVYEGLMSCIEFLCYIYSKSVLRPFKIAYAFVNLLHAFKHIYM